MSLLERLEREAKADPRPRELLVKDVEVPELAQWAVDTVSFPGSRHPADVAALMRAGGMRLHGITVRVVSTAGS